MSHYEVCNKVKKALLDSSFPSIVLLHGPWGCGKTHLTKKHLIPLLEREHPQSGTTQYISLYGVPTVESFRDVILSKYAFKNERALGWASTTKNTVGNVAKVFGDRGGSLGVLDALASPIKHKLISKLNNMIIIVDDLERASSESLINDVLGECLNLAENHSNVWIVVIANEQQIKDKTILEKTFVNRVPIDGTPDDIVRFIDERFPNLLDDKVKGIMKPLILELNLFNYRIIQRIMQRYAVIKESIERNKSIDHNQALPLVLTSISKICYVHYVDGFSREEIMESDGDFYQLVNDMPKDIGNVSERKDIEKQDARSLSLSKKLQSSLGHLLDWYVGFCLNGATLPNDFSISLRLPLCGTPVDRVMSFNFMDMSEGDFNKAVDETLTYLFSGDNKKIEYWIRALNSCVLLSKKLYIEASQECLIDRARDFVSDYIPNQLEVAGFNT